MRYISETTDMKNMELRVYDVGPEERAVGTPLPRRTRGGVLREDELSVETPDRTYRVEDGQLFIAEPENPHRVYNDSDTDTTVLGIGAPPLNDGHSYEE